MDITEPMPEPSPFEDEGHQPRRNPRQVLACFAVCVLAAVAVLLVARTDTTDPQAAAAPASSATERNDTGPVRRGSDDSEMPVVEGEDASLLERLFGDRLDGLFREPANQHDDRNATGSERAEGPAVGGRHFAIDIPENWTASVLGDVYEVASADRAAGVGIGALDAPPEGYRFEQWANEWEALARAELMSDVEVLERGPFSVNGLDGFRLRYTGSAGGEHLDGEVWWLADGEVVWTVSSGFPAGDEELAAVCEAIAGSFRPATRS